MMKRIWLMAPMAAALCAALSPAMGWASEPCVADEALGEPIGGGGAVDALVVDESFGDDIAEGEDLIADADSAAPSPDLGELISGEKEASPAEPDQGEALAKEAMVQPDAGDDLAELSPAPPVSDGVYEIRTAVDYGQLVDIAWGSTVPGAEIMVWHDNGSMNQKWRLTYLGDGLYSITSEYSGLSIGVASLDAENGTVLTQQAYAGLASQQWRIVSYGDGTYALVSDATGLYVDIFGVNPADGVRPNMWQHYADVIQQRFYLAAWTAPISRGETVEEGVYEIAPVDASGQRLDIAWASSDENASSMLWHDHAAATQKWQFTYTDEGFYVVTSLSSGKVLSFDNPYAGEGSLLVQKSYQGLLAQQWLVVPSGASYLLANAYNGLYIDVPYADYADSAHTPWGWRHYADVSQQRFYLIRSTAALDEGYYRIVDASGNYLESGAGETVWTDGWASGYSQVWELRADSRGNLALVSADTLKSLTASGQTAVMGSASQAFVWNIATGTYGGIALVTSGGALSPSGVLVGSQASTSNLPVWLFRSVSLASSGYVVVTDSAQGVLGLSRWSQDDGEYYYSYSHNDGSDIQRFYIEVLDDNAVTLRSCYTGKYLTKEGTSVRQRTGDGTGAQRFTLMSMGHGNFTLRADDGSVLSVWGTDVGFSGMGDGNARQSYSLSYVDAESPADRINRLLNVAYGEVGNTNGRKYEYALLNAGGSLCYTWDFWCATYVWWVFREAGLSPYFCNGQMLVYPQQEASFYSARDAFGWVPQRGDLCFMYYVPFPGGEYITHTEIVVDVNWATGIVTTIGGNPSVGVSYHYVYASNIRGYARVNWGI